MCENFGDNTSVGSFIDQEFVNSYHKHRAYNVVR